MILAATLGVDSRSWQVIDRRPRRDCESKDHVRRGARGGHRACAGRSRRSGPAYDQQRVDAAVGVVRPGVLQGLWKPTVHRRLRPAAPGCRSRAEPGDAAGDSVRAREAVQVQGREVHGRLPGLRRLDCTDRRVGRGQVLFERPCVRGGQDGPRRPRDVQLHLLEAHPPDHQPGSGRSACDALIGEHERGAHPQRRHDQPR